MSSDGPNTPPSAAVDSGNAANDGSKAASARPRKYRRREEPEDGCRLHDHCLTCPFPQCYLDPGVSITLLKSLKQLLERMAVVQERELDDVQAARHFGVSDSSWLRGKKLFFRHYPDRLPAETERLAALQARRREDQSPETPGRAEYDPNRLDPRHCAAPVYAQAEVFPAQCLRYRGHGPDGKYCRRHAALIQKGKLTPLAARN